VAQNQAGGECVTDELSFAAPTDRQALRREVALKLLVQAFGALLLQTARREDVTESVEKLIAGCWKLADRFIEAGEKPQP
jgi:hypothetical protein